MTFDEYQQAALRTSLTKNKKNDYFHLVLGLVGESGEIAEKTKKLIRDHDSDESMIDRDDIAKELGDVLWYIAVIADYLELPLDKIADSNIRKLADRHNRGKLMGSGDNR